MEMEIYVQSGARTYPLRTLNLFISHPFFLKTKVSSPQHWIPATGISEPDPSIEPQLTSRARSRRTEDSRATLKFTLIASLHSFPLLGVSCALQAFYVLQ